MLSIKSLLVSLPIINIKHNNFQMKKCLLLSVLSILFFTVAASAQILNKDSLKLAGRIRDDQEKLTKLQNSVSDKTKEKLETAQKAQESANDNQKAANKLGNDPQDKKLARRADHAASDARSDAKKARKAADRLDDLNKDIRNLTEQIAREQTKLNKYVEMYKNNIEAVPVAVPQKDSTKN
jgi:hypothetical protein